MTSDLDIEARAVVAAVRPLIAAETLRAAAQDLYEHRCDDGAWDLYEAGGPEWLTNRADETEADHG